MLNRMKLENQISNVSVINGTKKKERNTLFIIKCNDTKLQTLTRVKPSDEAAAEAST